MKLLLCTLLALAGLAAAYERDYTGYTIQECSTEFEDSKDLLLGIIHAFDLEIIAEKPKSVEVLAEPRMNELFQGLHCKVIVEDLQVAIEEEQAHLKQTREVYFKNMNDSDAYHKTYHPYEEIVEKLKEIAAQFPNIVTLSSYGTSLQGRDLPLVKISGSTSGSKKTIYFNSGIHAREWIGPATAVYVIQNLAEKYGSDSTVTRLLDAIDFYITPESNPDGYSYSWTSDRMWRKNRNNNNGNSCKGVDLNRNFDVYWGTGSSNRPCSGDYHGSSPASEPEVQAIQNLVISLKNRIGAVDIHSYGQYIMRPYGWTYDFHPEESILKTLGDGMVREIQAVNGVKYSSIRSAELYPVSGASDDWFTVDQKLWGFCFELRDGGRYGFRLPEDQILPTGQEIFAAILHYASFNLENFTPV